MTEGKKNRILKKIEKFKKALRSEKATFGAYHDGGGIRYAIAELYFELKDHKKTNRYLNWFDKNFPDDGKYSHYELGEAVARFETGKLNQAKLSIIDLNAHNTYLVDLIIGNQISTQDKYEWMESESFNWAKQNLDAHLNLVTDNFTIWLGEFRSELMYKKWYKRLISIQKLLQDVDEENERSNLLDAQDQCLDDWKEELKIR